MNDHTDKQNMGLFHNYPLNVEALLTKKRRIKRDLLEALDGKCIKKKIAVLGGSTTNEVADQIELFLLHHGIRTELYQSEYNRYWQDAVFGNDKLDAFKPDIIYIHTNWRNITAFPELNMDQASVNRLVENEYLRFEQMWTALEERFHCPVIQNNFERPNYRLLGNMDISADTGRSHFIHLLNSKLYEYSNSHESFHINDLEYLASDYGITKWNDTRFWNLYKYAMPLDAIPGIAFSVSNIIKSIYGKNKKVLALDLDNTLWGGVVGDDGVEGIRIGPEIPEGQIYLEFQNYCRELKKLGVILAANSKNEEENAMAGLNHPDGVLKPEDFVSIKANWNSKDSNMIELANELELGTDSFVFLDDNPAERAIVEAGVQGVSIIDADYVDDFIVKMDHSGFFESVSLSLEDRNKTELYHAKLAAQKMQFSYVDYNAYLKDLEMKAYIMPFNSRNLVRVAQLTNKSNQFNLTTMRCSMEDINRMSADCNYVCLCGKLVDKFADHGIVSIVIGEQKQETLHIRLFLMSCRVLKRGMEDVMTNQLMEIAKKRGIKKVFGYYYPTRKNRMVEDFYLQYHFKLIEKTDSGNKTFEINTDAYEGKKTQIGVDIISSNHIDG